MAGLGAIRQDAVRLRPVLLEKPLPIPLVKSDLKTSPETRNRPPIPFLSNRPLCSIPEALPQPIRNNIITDFCLIATDIGV